MNELFSRRYDVGPEMLLDFLQQAMAGIPTVTAFQLADSGDRIDFTTSFTLTSWGERMVAAVESDGPDGSVLRVSGEPRNQLLSTPWGEEVHAATIETQLLTALEPSILLTRSNPIVMLQADHRRVEALFVRIQATDDGERAELVQQLLLALRVHMELEESYVYPLLEREVDADLAEEAEVEHQLARDGLDQLAELTPDEPGFDGALVMVMAGIEHHVMEEETEAFPRLAGQLGPERLAELAQQLTDVRAELLEEALNSRSERLNEPPSKEQGKSESKTQDKSESKEPAKSESKTQDKSESKGPAKPRAQQPARPARPKRESDRARTPRSRRSRPQIDPDEMTKADLVTQAKKAGISGYSHMSKAELAKAITQAK